MAKPTIRKVWLTQAEYQTLIESKSAMFQPVDALKQSLVEWFRDHDHTEYWLLNPDGSKPMESFSVTKA